MNRISVDPCGTEIEGVLLSRVNSILARTRIVNPCNTNANHAYWEILISIGNLSEKLDRDRCTTCSSVNFSDCSLCRF